jgi:hypothetical protein
MVVCVELLTAVVVIVNVALVLPLVTVTFAGTPAADELELKETAMPAPGAAPLNVTVPWDVFPPVTLVGFTLRETRVGRGLTVNVAVTVTPPETAEITVDVWLVTELVLTVNVAVVLPAGTVTLDGTPAADELALNDTTMPPLGAGPLNVTVAWEVLPAITLVGFRPRETRIGKTVIVAVATLLLYVSSLAMYVKLSFPT